MLNQAVVISVLMLLAVGSIVTDTNILGTKGSNSRFSVDQTFQKLAFFNFTTLARPSWQQSSKFRD